MALQLKQAQRSKAYLKLGMSAPSGGGKTLGALLIAYGLMKRKYPNEPEDVLWGKIAIVDTENRSGELYVNKEVANIVIGTYNAVTLDPPFSADKYTSAIDLCAEHAIEVCIIDSTTHLWSGEGGLLELQNAAAKRSGNSYTAWRDITPQHNRFVEAILQTPMHVIATMRSKQEYVQEKSSEGKTTVRKLGLEPEQRKGMEYEFTTFFEVNAEHEAFGAKDRTSLFDQKTFKITPKVGMELMNWLEGGTSETPVVLATEVMPVDKEAAVTSVKGDLVDMIRSMGGSSNEALMSLIKRYAPNGNVNTISNVEELGNLRSELVDFKTSLNTETVDATEASVETV